MTCVQLKPCQCHKNYDTEKMTAITVPVQNLYVNKNQLKMKKEGASLDPIE